MNNLLRCLVEKSMRKKNEYGIDRFDNLMGVIKDIEVEKYDLSVCCCCWERGYQNLQR